MCVTVLKWVCAVFWLIDEPSSHSIPGIFGIFPVLQSSCTLITTMEVFTISPPTKWTCVCVFVCKFALAQTVRVWWSVQKRQKMAVMSNIFNTDNAQNSSVSVCALEGSVSSCAHSCNCALNCNWAAGLYEAAINLSLLC